MPPRIRLITLGICIFIVAYVFELVRRRHLNEEYSMGWLITGILMLVMSYKIDLLAKITNFVGSEAVTSTLFFLGLLFLVIICLHFSIRISNLTNQVRRLSQHLAIMNHEVSSIKKEPDHIIEMLNIPKDLVDKVKTGEPLEERVLIVNKLINEDIKNH